MFEALLNRDQLLLPVKSGQNMRYMQPCRTRSYPEKRDFIRNLIVCLLDRFRLDPRDRTRSFLGTLTCLIPFVLNAQRMLSAPFRSW
ncbi:hypothetical protein BD414DRAFT_522286 [Trametes punicea]|nr:hypothetical protein BD414DRAFT_522286 [Trametes punicea]